MSRYDGRFGYGSEFRARRPARAHRPGADWVQGVGRSGERGYRGTDWSRPWVGGYREGYQGGSGGIPTSPGLPPAYDRDYWWLGEHEIRRRGGYDRGLRYDARYHRFDRETHPRYSPVGGTYAPMGGRFAYGRQPGPMRDETWFSDWTRWF